MAEDYAARVQELPRRPLEGGLTLVVADSPRTRRRALTGLDAMPAGHALHIDPCRSVHTIGMRFALDLVWLRADGEVARVDRDITPGRVRMCPRARSVVEAKAGRADAFLAAGLGRSRHPGRE